MAAEKVYAQEREKLLELGVPAHVVEQVLAQNPIRGLYVTSVFCFIAIMLGGFGVGALSWSVLEQMTAARIADAAREASAILYDFTFGFSLLFALFGWILAAGLVSSMIFLGTARGRATMFVYSQLAASGKSRDFMKQRLARFSDVTSAEDYVRAATSGGLPMVAAFAGLLFALAAYSFERESAAYSLYTKQGYELRPYFPWDAPKRGPWSDAVSVELGCNHVAGKNASDDIIYKINFNGFDRGLYDAVPVSGVWIDAIETIDAELIAANTPFRRWAWMGRDPLHPRCLAAQRRMRGDADMARVEKLLRIGDFPQDQR